MPARPNEDGMKTRDLIRRLQEADPSGELECGVDGTDIYFVSCEEGYWDGPYEVLIRDPELDGKAYSILGVKSTTKGNKVRLHTMSLHDVLLNDPSARVEVEYEYSDPSRAQRFLERAEETRRRIHEMNNGLEREDFVRWAITRFPDVRPSTAAEFWNAHYTHDTPVPDDIDAMTETTQGSGGTWNTWHISRADKRRLQWQREVSSEAGILMKVA